MNPNRSNNFAARNRVTLPRLQHVAIPITEGAQDAIRLFYQDLLGFAEKTVPRALAGKGLVWFSAGDHEMELHCIPDSYLAEAEEARHLCLEVDDLATYRQKLMDAGYQIVDADPIPYRPRFFTFDPCGNHIEFTSIEDDYRKAEANEAEKDGHTNGV